MVIGHWGPGGQKHGSSQGVPEEDGKVGELLCLRFGFPK